MHRIYAHITRSHFVLFVQLVQLVLIVLSSRTDALLPSGIQRPFLKTQLRQACLQKNEAKIFQLVEQLQVLNPTTNIITDFDKLGGDWKLEFTTAPEAEVPREQSSEQTIANGDVETKTTTVKTYQSIDTTAGVIYNVIDRGLPENGLRIAVGAEPTRSNRVALDFRTIESFNSRFPKKVVLNFPPRNFFRTLFRIQKFVLGKSYDEMEFKEIGHFDLLFLDENLRIQRNSEGNLFINSKM